MIATLSYLLEEVLVNSARGPWPIMRSQVSGIIWVALCSLSLPAASPVGATSSLL